MTWALAMTILGAVWLVSAVQNRSVTEVFQGIWQPSPDSDLLASIVATRQARAGAALPPSLVSAPAAPSGLGTFEGVPVCRWVARELTIARRNGWTGRVTSGYRSAADQARVCASVPAGTPCAEPGESRHQGTAWPSCAVDVSDGENLARYLRKGSPLRWAGNRDRPHYSAGAGIGGSGY